MVRNFLSTLSAEQLLSEPDTLAVLSYKGGEIVAAENPNIATIPSIRVAEVSERDCLEVWKSSNSIIDHGSINHGVEGDCTWRRSDDLQFVTVTAPLTEADDFESTSYAVYSKILSFIEKSPHTELVRFWNYIPHINHGSGDNENYKRFCAGRLAAFTEHDLADLQFPAASAVGHYTDGITVCALTGSIAAQHHANPRQVDAFKYPRQYGPSSPSFARATTVNFADQRLCFISGTASILGHDTVHRGNLRLQLYTTSDNIRYLLKETGFSRKAISTLRVYLRDTADYEECKSIVGELFPDTNAIFTHADICRSDLLVEIECFCIDQ